VLVRDPGEGQNVWIVTPSGTLPASVAGFGSPTAVAHFPGADLYEARRGS